MHIGPVAIAVIVLLAVVVAFLVPVLLQLRRTLTSLEHFLDTTGKRLEQVLDEANGTLARLNRISAELEAGTEHVRSLATAAGDLGRTFTSLRASIPTAAALGTALGPALVALAQALLSRWTSGAAAPAAGPADGGGPSSAAQGVKP